MYEEGTKRERILILGAAGRDFHNFNVFFRSRPEFEVVGFTAAQIPQIACRLYPPELSGRLYPAGLPIWPEDALEDIIVKCHVDRCILSYSDLGHQEVMHLAEKVLARGADFGFLGVRNTMLKSNKPVIAVCAVRTGAGKSQVVRYIAEIFRQAGLKAVVVRHPMPYGDLAQQVVQRFSSRADLDAADLTLEEREEYERHIDRGTVVYAGVDYQRILDQAQREADVVLWDGGNNDTPFFSPDLWITVADALRPGHEISYYPGETNFLAADLIVINKANSAAEEDIIAIQTNASRLNPAAAVVVAGSEVRAEDPGAISGKRVLIVEDGPTITHGGMAYGAGMVAARRYDAAEVVDPRPYATGSLKEIYSQFRHIGKVLPAMGYYPQQIRELEETINNADCDSVIIASPIDLGRIIRINKPSTYVLYDLVDMDRPYLRDKIEEFISKSISMSKSTSDSTSKTTSRSMPGSADEGD